MVYLRDLPGGVLFKVVRTGARFIKTDNRMGGSHRYCCLNLKNDSVMELNGQTRVKQVLRVRDGEVLNAV